jgi:hypothetical protein
VTPAAGSWRLRDRAGPEDRLAGVIYLSGEAGETLQLDQCKARTARTTTARTITADAQNAGDRRASRGEETTSSRRRR